MKVELTQEWCMNMAKIEESADDAATMCVWCEQRVQGACKSHYDTLTCTHRVIVPTAEEWGSAVEARAAELHEGCRMPIEQARELAASEAGPDWYARGQDWALADSLSGSLPNDWTAGDIARAYAAGARAGEGALAADATRLVDKCNSYIVDNARLAEQVEILRAEVAQARQTAEYWKAEHLAGNARIGELHDELAATALRSADHLRRAIKAEAEVALLRAALNGGNVIERLQFALQRLADAADGVGVRHFDTDWLSDEVQELQAATHAARLVLGPNPELSRARRRLE